MDHNNVKISEVLVNQSGEILKETGRIQHQYKYDAFVKGHIDVVVITSNDTTVNTLTVSGKNWLGRISGRLVRERSFHFNLSPIVTPSSTVHLGFHEIESKDSKPLNCNSNAKLEKIKFVSN